MDLDSAKERLLESVAKLKGDRIIKSQKDIAEIMGMNPNTISQALKGNPKYLTLSFITKFSNTFTSINNDWLITGSDGSVNLSMTELIEKRERKNQLKEPDAIWVKYERFKLVPLVPKRAQAGFLRGWGDDDYLEELPKVPWEVDKEYKGKYMTFEVEGYSMESNNEPRDSIFDGDLLLCREVQRSLWNNKLHINKWDFVIVHREDGILVKRITEHDVNTGKLTLHSLNPEYIDQIVYMDDLIAIFNIVDIRRSRRR